MQMHICLIICCFLLSRVVKCFELDKLYSDRFETTLTLGEASEESVNYFNQLFDNPTVRLLYRGSDDGFNADNFHKYCDGEDKTVTLVIIEGNEELIGGYAEDAWSSPVWPISIRDEESFIFSLTKLEKYI